MVIQIVRAANTYHSLSQEVSLERRGKMSEIGQDDEGNALTEHYQNLDACFNTARNSRTSISARKVTFL